MKKIFVFSKTPFAGNSTFIDTLLKFKDKKFNLRFFFYENPTNSSPLSNNLIYLNTTHPSSLKPTFYKILLFIKNCLKTYFLLKKEQPKIIMIVGIYSLIVVNIVTIFLKTKPLIVFNVEINVFRYILSKPFFIYQKILMLLTNYIIFRIKYFIFVSQDIFLDFKRKFKINNLIKYSIIHHGINLDLAKKLGNKQIPKEEKILLNTDNIKIISIGRFEEQKDFSTIIRAFKIIKKKIPSTKLVLIGDGSLKNQLKNLSEMLHLRNSVYFLGWKKNVFPYLKNSDIFVYSSNYEGFGYVILEAMSQSLPIIATNTPHTPSEILAQGKYGILVPVGDKKKMAEAIIRVAKNKKLRKKYRLLAYERVKYFNEKKMLKKYQEFFIELLSNN